MMAWRRYAILERGVGVAKVCDTVNNRLLRALKLHPRPAKLRCRDDVLAARLSFTGMLRVRPSCLPLYLHPPSFT